jgi:hypothetical protein
MGYINMLCRQNTLDMIPHTEWTVEGWGLYHSVRARTLWHTAFRSVTYNLITLCLTWNFLLKCTWKIIICHSHYGHGFARGMELCDIVHTRHRKVAPTGQECVWLGVFQDEFLCKYINTTLCRTSPPPQRGGGYLTNIIRKINLPSSINFSHKLTNYRTLGGQLTLSSDTN